MNIFFSVCLLVLFTFSCGNHAPSNTSIVQVSPFKLLQDEKIDANNFELFLRAFKKEQFLEVWAKDKTTERFIKIQSYDFCTTSGVLGPKRQEGDYQIPEGCYWIDRFNPNSKFHLSLGLNYPNDSDRILGHSQRPGSDIFIHGGCASVGCIPITNQKIEELYALATKAQELGQRKIQVHIFPSNKMEKLLQKRSKNKAFWQNLLPIFNYFDTTNKLPKVWIKPNGAYAIAN